jgi:hypothetical protein
MEQTLPALARKVLTLETSADLLKQIKKVNPLGKKRLSAGIEYTTKAKDALAQNKEQETIDSINLALERFNAFCDTLPHQKGAAILTVLSRIYNLPNKD